MYLKSLKKQFVENWFFWGLVSFYLFIILASFFGSHVLKNLEPYPDSLYYLSQAKELAQTGKLRLRYQDSVINFHVPPFYSLVLSPFFLFTQNPQIFVIANIIFGITSLVLIMLIISEKTKSKSAIAIATLILLSHFSFIWFSTLPMTELLGLTLMLLSFYLIIKKKINLWNLLIIFTLLLSLILTKYLYVTLAMGLGLILLIRLIKEKQSKMLQVIFGLILFSGLLLILFLQKIHYRPFDVFTYLFNSHLNAFYFYSFSYIKQNLLFYLQTLLGINSQMLWLKTPLSSAGILFLFFFSLFKLWQNKANKFFALSIFILFCSLFPILLIFYAKDARYLFFVPALMALAISINWEQSRGKQKFYLSLSIAVSLCLQIFTQAPLLKIILSQNILHHSTAWQYEAIQNYNKYFIEDNNAYLITALPPFFVDFYDNGNYRVLPLSNNQEFINKNQWVWGSDLDLSADEAKNKNLYDLYNKLLAEEKQIYISNSYITHNHLVIEDYEKLKKNYNFELVQEGCNNACNIYELRPSPE